MITKQVSEANIKWPRSGVGLSADASAEILGKPAGRRETRELAAEWVRRFAANSSPGDGHAQPSELVCRLRREADRSASIAARYRTIAAMAPNAAGYRTGWHVPTLRRMPLARWA